MKAKIKLGFLPTFGEVFDFEDAKRVAGEVREWLKKNETIELVDIDWLNEHKIYYNEGDMEKVLEYFQAQKVDAVFNVVCAFGAELSVCRIMKELRKPLLLWGPRDEYPREDGWRKRDSQCGALATSKCLRRFNLPFSYIVSSTVDSTTFQNGFDTFVRVANILKTFRNLRIGQIDTRPKTFMSVMVNETELLERFGIQIVPCSLVNITDAVFEMIEKNRAELEKEVEEYKKEVCCCGIEDEKILRIIALKHAIKDFAVREGCAVVAMHCWHEVEARLGVSPCAAMGMVSSEGIPVTCETDIHGAISAAIAGAATLGESSVLFPDITIRHPENPNAELIWHCGPFPMSEKKCGAPAKLSDDHYNFNDGCPGCGEFLMRDGDITMVRFDGALGEYGVLLAEGKTVEGPFTRGTYMYAEFANWPKIEYTVANGYYCHHAAVVYGKVAVALSEFARYIGIDVDAMGPTKEEIQDYLIGD